MAVAAARQLEADRLTVCQLAGCRWINVSTGSCALLLLLAGCGATLIYPRFDTLAAFYFQDLVSLDDAQSEQLSSTLSRNLEWHRSSELTKYASFLNSLAGSLGQGVDGDEWLRATRQTEEYWRDIFEQAAPGYIAVAATLSDAQVDELLANLAKRDEKTWQEFARRTPQERRDRRERSTRKALERFYPSLKDMKLVDYKVRVINPRSGTAAKVRVIIESQDKEDIWNTVGVSENVIEASWYALVDSIEYKLLKEQEVEAKG